MKPTRTSVAQAMQSASSYAFHELESLLVCAQSTVGPLIDELADDAAFLYQGWLAERGPSRELLREPRSPYGRGLLNAVPTLWNRKELRGIRSSDGSSTAGCPFADRCAQVVEPCRTTIPVLQPLADAENRERLVACVRGGIVERLRASGVVKRYRNVGRSTPPAACWPRRRPAIRPILPTPCPHPRRP